MLQNAWNRWLSRDPVRMVEKYGKNLNMLKFICLDCGTRDEFNLHWGDRIPRSKLESTNIKHYYEEFNDGHMQAIDTINHYQKIYSALSYVVWS